MPDDPKPASDRVFNAPRLAINRVYTRKGDAGQTQLVGGQRIDKDDERLEAYGTIDELNAAVGLARCDVAIAAGSGVPRLWELERMLSRVQHELFNLGSILATLPEDVHPRQPRVTDVEIRRLEEDIDRCQEDLDPLRSFVLPGGSRLDAELHLARTVCRRAERSCVRLARHASIDPTAIAYLNRLSDALFVWSRWASKLAGANETLWEPDASASGEASKTAPSGEGSSDPRGR